MDVEDDWHGHLLGVHVYSGLDKTKYECLWEGCRFYGRQSTSRKYIEGHVLTHCPQGSRPLKCIMDECGQRFKSLEALNRHVQAHLTKIDSVMTSNLSSGDSRSTRVQKRSHQSAARSGSKKNSQMVRHRKESQRPDIFRVNVMNAISVELNNFLFTDRDQKH
ncbi:hypothetical protein ACOME3_009740 [Neoechinorhynchus agilis]